MKEFSHGSDDGNEARFALVEQALAEATDGRVVCFGDDGGHVELSAHDGLAKLGDAGAALSLARLAKGWSQFIRDVICDAVADWGF